MKNYLTIIGRQLLSDEDIPPYPGTTVKNKAKPLNETYNSEDISIMLKSLQEAIEKWLKENPNGLN